MSHFNLGRGPNHKTTVTAAEIILALRRARLSKGLSQEKVAQQCNYDTNMVQRWENGRVAPSINAVISWAQALGLEIILKEKE